MKKIHTIRLKPSNGLCRWQVYTLVIVVLHDFPLLGDHQVQNLQNRGASDSLLMNSRSRKVQSPLGAKRPAPAGYRESTRPPQSQSDHSQNTLLSGRYPVVQLSRTCRARVHPRPFSSELGHVSPGLPSWNTLSSCCDFWERKPAKRQHCDIGVLILVK